jgi:hypothetical protein
MTIAEQRNQLQMQLNTLAADLKHHSDNLNSEYFAQVQIAKHMWNNGRIQFETNKLNRMLPSRSGRVPIGTQITQHYRTRPDRTGRAEAIGDCLADIVDCVDGIAQGRLRNEHCEPFVAPVLSDLESLQRAKQVEATKRLEFNALTLRLRTSEGDRMRAWRRLLKVKADFKSPYQFMHNGTWRSIDLDPTSCASLPMPGLSATATQRVVEPTNMGQAFVSSYTPSHAARYPPAGSMLMSDSKYSTARVRDRIAVDGTVAPVTKPKVNKEGLYQRPAGRTRKGMEWDTVRGIWIPAAGASGQS